jgi:CrcB protein
LAVGILGGYRTFSTYTHETLQLIQDGELGMATANTIGQVVAGLTAVYLGVVLGRVFGGT